MKRLAIVMAASALSGCLATTGAVAPVGAFAGGYADGRNGVPPAQAQGVTAYPTGRQQYVQSVTNQPAVQCEYQYAGHAFWRTFLGGQCPRQVQVQ